MSVIERLLGRGNTGGAGGPGRPAITPMRRRDLRGGVLDIEQRCYPRPWSHGVFSSELDQVRSGARHYVVARVGKQIAGYAGLWFTADEAHVTNIAVDPAVRRSGIGKALMLNLARTAIDRECVAWTLEVRVSSAGAQEMYREFGFAPAGVRQRYYENVEDAIVMWCHDIQTDAYRHRLEELERSFR